MTTNAANDLLDEDSAVLQFPKDWQNRKRPGSWQFKQEECLFCGLLLEETYICCATCNNVNICPPCFSQGAESTTHKNNHPYSVLTNEIPLFIHNWSARDEQKLLDAILDCGFGNWEDVSCRLVTHSAEECKNHYVNYYIENRPFPDLPRFKESLLSYTETPIYKYRHTNMDDPPRYAPDTVGYRSLAGYNAGRGDFEMEYDNNAELVLEDVDLSLTLPGDKDYVLMRSLETALGYAYNERLMERKRRHRIIQEHGLIQMRRTYSWMHRFEFTITRPVAERLTRFMQVLSAYDFDMLFERLHNAGELRRYLNRLSEFSANGLQRVSSCRLYMQLKEQRKELQKNREHKLCSSLMFANKSNTVGIAPRKIAPPLDVVGMPGYERLTPNEQELCATARIVPDSYADFKRILQTECNKHGFLKLAQARTMIKIDVNKTRKLFDFMVREGYINQSLQTTRNPESNEALVGILNIPAEEAVVEAETMETEGVETEPLQDEEIIETMTLKNEPIQTITLKSEPVETITIKSEPIDAIAIKSEPIDAIAIKSEPMD